MLCTKHTQNQQVTTAGESSLLLISLSSSNMILTASPTQLTASEIETCPSSPALLPSALRKQRLQSDPEEQLSHRASPNLDPSPPASLCQAAGWHYQHLCLGLQLFKHSGWGQVCPTSLQKPGQPEAPTLEMARLCRHNTLWAEMFHFTAGLISTGREVHQHHYLLQGVALCSSGVEHSTQVGGCPNWSPWYHCTPKWPQIIPIYHTAPCGIWAAEGLGNHVSRKDVVQHLRVHVFSSIPHHCPSMCSPT